MTILSLLAVRRFWDSFRTHYAAGARHCLEVHDLLAAKAISGREKDIDFISEAAKHGMAHKDELLTRLELVNADPCMCRRHGAEIREEVI